MRTRKEDAVTSPERPVPPIDVDAVLATLAKMTPGEQLRWKCMNGQCGVFAAVVSAFTGWSIMSIEARDPAGVATPVGIHAGVLVPGEYGGGFMDAEGVHPDLPLYAVATVAVSPNWSHRQAGVAYLDEADYGYGLGYDELPNATVVEIANLVFAQLKEIGYKIPAHRADMTREEIADLLIGALASCVGVDPDEVTPQRKTVPVLVAQVTPPRTRSQGDPHAQQPAT